MKIGIITHYYKSRNYGGNLQAYALCAYLKSKGYQAEQICYKPGCIFKSNYNTYDKFIKALKMIYSAWIHRRDILVSNLLYKRKKSLYNFNKKIPHSKRVYTSANIGRGGNDYDAYIVGSDQVWHPNTICDAYVLNFVGQNKIKISYAASLAVETLLPKQIEILKNALPSFKRISVRENSAIDLLRRYIDDNIEWVVDPTLLLSEAEWNTFCRKRIIQESYIFCYFLGGDVCARNTAENFAKEHNLTIVTLPYLNNHYRKCDDGYGDIRLKEVSPEAFVSLIKYADFIFTDSFHGTVFSGVFNRHFVVFGRDDYIEMEGRIKSLLQLFNAAKCFCDSNEKKSIKYIDKIYSETVNYKTQILIENINASKEFLEKALEV